MRRATRRNALALFLVIAATATATSGASTADAATVPAPTGIDGRLMVAHGDTSTNGGMVMQTVLQTASGPVPLELSPSEHTNAVSLAGTRVRVTGTRLATSFAATSIVPVSGMKIANAHASVPAGTKRTMRIAVVLLRLPGSPAEPVSKASVRAATFGATNSVAHWYSQMSGKQIVVSGAVYGYYNGVKSCDISAQTLAAETAAKKDGYVAANYDHIVVYAPPQVCGCRVWGGGAANGVFLNGSVDRGLIEHEIGHNLGLRHAGAYACGVAAFSPSCLVDYADGTDVMGATQPNHGYSAEHKYMLGWLPASAVRTVTTGTQTIALNASLNPLLAGTTQLIHVRAADGTLYAIDRRASVGYDAGLSGVWIREVANVNTDDTALVRNRAFRAGESFVSAKHAVTIKTMTDSGPAASVRVCIGPCAVPVGTQTVPAPVTARNIATAAKSAPTNAGITVTVPAGRGVVTGHTVVVSTYAGAAIGAVSCRDSRGNAYAVNVTGAGPQRLIVCTAHVTYALPVGATITTTYPVFSGAAVSSANDFSGIKATARVDTTRESAGTGAVVTAGPSVTTTRAAEVVFGVEIHRGAPTFTPVAGYTRVGAVSRGSGATRMTVTPAYKIVTATGAYTFGGSLSASAQWRAALVTLFRA